MYPYLVLPDSKPQQWTRTTLRELGYGEVFLEKLVADCPGVLGLDPYETGITRTVVSFRQRQLPTPTGRSVIPDVVLLSESGHVVIVEAKLADNPDLRNRQVLAQVIDYAASVANLGDDDLLGWLEAEEGESWGDFVRRTFPKSESPERLAAALRRRMRDAELHLVIVCDGAPDGLRELVTAVAGQAALGAFKLHVVELLPYTAVGVEGVLLVPAPVAQTEIVARTAITVAYIGAQQPVVSVVASSAEEVAEAIKDVRAGRTMRPEFTAVIERYEAIVPEELRTRTQPASYNYKQVQPPGWPTGIHYEFLDRSGGGENVGVELHVESKELRLVSEDLGPIAQRIGATHDPKWCRGKGRIFRRVSVIDAAGAAKAMVRLIDDTRNEITALLAKEVQPASSSNGSTTNGASTLVNP